MNLRDVVKEARENSKAVGHFNISNLETLHGIFNSAKAFGVPVIIGVSEGERDFVGVKESVALIKTLRDSHNYPIFLNADHTYSVARVKEAIDAGFDSVIFDGAKLSLSENIAQTKECVLYAKQSGRDVLVEGELGYIGQSSKILEGVPEGVELTSVSDAKKYVEETGLDFFAPAVGNIHGMLRDVPDPRLNIARIKEISDEVKIPLVLHGASGNSDEDIQSAIKSGVGIVHINTEVRVAFRDALKESLKSDEVAPYKFEAGALKAVEDLVKKKLRVFNFL